MHERVQTSASAVGVHGEKDSKRQRQSTIGLGRGRARRVQSSTRELQERPRQIGSGKRARGRRGEESGRRSVVLTRWWGDVERRGDGCRRRDSRVQMDRRTGGEIGLFGETEIVAIGIGTSRKSHRSRRSGHMRRRSRATLARGSRRSEWAGRLVHVPRSDWRRKDRIGKGFSIVSLQLGPSVGAFGHVRVHGKTLRG